MAKMPDGWILIPKESKTDYEVAMRELVCCRSCKYGIMRKNCYGDDRVECSNPDSPVREYALTSLLLPDWFCADGEPREKEEDA